MIFLNIDKRLEKNGYKIVRDDKYGVEYEKEEPQGYKHKVAILHKASGNHIMQSYTDINQVVALTLKELILFTRKFKQISRAWNRRTKDDTPMVATAFRGSDLTEEEESALDHLFDVMTAVKQQVLLRKALHSQSPDA